MPASISPAASEIELGSALRNTLQLEPGRRLPIADAAHAFGNPCDGFLVETVLVFEETSRPNGGGGQPVLHADALAVQISGRTDARVFIYIDIRMAEHPFDENGYRRIAEGFVLQIGDVYAGVELGDIELLAIDFGMPARISG